MKFYALFMTTILTISISAFAETVCRNLPKNVDLNAKKWITKNHLRACEQEIRGACNIYRGSDHSGYDQVGQLVVQNCKRHLDRVNELMANGSSRYPEEKQGLIDEAELIKGLVVGYIDHTKVKLTHPQEVWVQNLKFGTQAASLPAPTNPR